MGLIEIFWRPPEGLRPYTLRTSGLNYIPESVKHVVFIAKLIFINKLQLKLDNVKNLNFSLLFFYIKMLLPCYSGLL